MQHHTAPSRADFLRHQRNEAKIIRIHPIAQNSHPVLAKPPWLRVKWRTSQRVEDLRKMLRVSNLHTVCEEACCPNLVDCFSHGTVTFMILGDLCTRRCPFCDVAHGRPIQPDSTEPENLAALVKQLGLAHVVITSVNRDDLIDGGAAQFVQCIRAIRAIAPDVCIEILTPDFRGRLDVALEALSQSPADIFNHNVETIPRLYRRVRPGADYRHSLQLLARHKARHPQIPTKSGLMLGLGETLAEVEALILDLYEHQVEMLTIGQYLKPGEGYLPVEYYVTPKEFAYLERFAYRVGFSSVASSPLMRSSYHAEQQNKQHRASTN